MLDINLKMYYLITSVLIVLEILLLLGLLIGMNYFVVVYHRIIHHNIRVYIPIKICIHTFNLT